MGSFLEKVSIRRAGKDDALRISNLYQDIYDGTYSDVTMRDLRLLRGVLSSSEYCWIVGEVAGEVVASVAFRMDLRNKLAKVFGAVVDPRYRGQNLTQKLMIYGSEVMAQDLNPVEVIYATTRTVSYEPQILTSGLGYKKLGVFPNVHKTDSYETHCLTAFYYPGISSKRFKDFNLHPGLLPIYNIARKECDLESLSVVDAGSIKVQKNIPEPLLLEAISAPLFVRHRFIDEKPKSDDHEWFYPFQDPNVILTTPDQSVEVFAYFSEIDKSCVLIGIRDLRNVGAPRIFLAATEALRKMGARYIEFLIRADETDKIQSAFDTQYIPSAYFPAMQLSQGMRFDFVVFSRSFEILDFRKARLAGVNLEYLKLYSKCWESAALVPSV